MKRNSRVGSISAALFLLLGLCTGCGVSKTAPPELAGRWTTTAKTQADRFLDITPSSITFGLGEGGSSVHHIAGVRAKKLSGQETAFTIRYLDSDQNELRMTLVYRSDAQTIQLQNRSEIWKKEGS